MWTLFSGIYDKTNNACQNSYHTQINSRLILIRGSMALGMILEYRVDMRCRICNVSFFIYMTFIIENT